MDRRGHGKHVFRGLIMVDGKGCHTVDRHRQHVVWATRYRYDVLRGELWLRIKEIIRQRCPELGVEIIKGV